MLFNRLHSLQSSGKDWGYENTKAAPAYQDVAAVPGSTIQECTNK